MRTSYQRRSMIVFVPSGAGLSRSSSSSKQQAAEQCLYIYIWEVAKCNGPKYSRAQQRNEASQCPSVYYLYILRPAGGCVYLAAQPILARHIICHTALKREEKREWRRIASPSPPVHQVCRLNLKHPGLILGGSTGVSLNAHPAHRQPSTSPSARYWAEGPAE